MSRAYDIALDHVWLGGALAQSQNPDCCLHRAAFLCKDFKMKILFVNPQVQLHQLGEQPAQINQFVQYCCQQSNLNSDRPGAKFTESKDTIAAQDKGCLDRTLTRLSCGVPSAMHIPKAADPSDHPYFPNPPLL